MEEEDLDRYGGRKVTFFILKAKCKDLKDGSAITSICRWFKFESQNPHGSLELPVIPVWRNAALEANSALRKRS